METFEQVRRDRDREGLSIRALAERHGVHRRAVRQALVSPLPPVKRAPVGRPAPKLGAYREVIDAWLVADRDAPRKQRHTARRVWQRLVAEHGAQVSERQVSRYVRERRVALGEVGEAFVPQLHAPGIEGEVDWGEAWVLLGGRRTKVHLFHLRLCHSGAAFAAAFLNETQQAFLEGHADAFAFLGGVPASVRYEYVPRHIFEQRVGRRPAERAQRPIERHHHRRRRLVPQRQDDPVARPRKPRAEQHRRPSADDRPVAVVPLHPQTRLNDPRPRPPAMPGAPAPLRVGDRATRDALRTHVAHRDEALMRDIRTDLPARAIDPLLDLLRERVHTRPRPTWHEHSAASLVTRAHPVRNRLVIAARQLRRATQRAGQVIRLQDLHHFLRALQAGRSHARR